jgi:hypothetical protein
VSDTAEELAAGAKQFVAGATAAEPAGDREVMTAFALGWQMSELYNPGWWPPNDATPEPDLPGISELGGKQRAEIGLKQATVALKTLENTVKSAGLSLPTAADAEGKLPSAPEPEYRKAIFNLHVELLTTLTAAHFKLGKSYGLGRALADTTRLPHERKTLREEFNPHRIATLEAWVSDLTTLLPPHAGHSVNKSLAEWTAWANQQQDEGELDEKTVGLLRRQGERWRALLSGEKHGADNLKFREYVEAGVEALSQARRLVWEFLRHYWIGISLVLLLLIGSVALILLDNSAAQVAAGIAGLLASVGISLKGIGATLGKAAAQIERPIWGASIDVEISEAITILPGTTRAETYTPPQPHARLARSAPAPETTITAPSS